MPVGMFKHKQVHWKAIGRSAGRGRSVGGRRWWGGGGGGWRQKGALMQMYAQTSSSYAYGREGLHRGMSAATERVEKRQQTLGNAVMRGGVFMRISERRREERIVCGTWWLK